MQTTREAHPFDIEAYQKWRRNKHEECCLQNAIGIIRSVFVGVGVLTTALSRLQALKQTSEQNGKTVTLSVAAYFDKFNALVAELDQNQPYGLISSTFFHNLNDKIKDHMASALNYVPHQHPGNNPVEMGRIIRARDVAVRSEGALKAQLETANTVLQAARSHRAAPTLAGCQRGSAMMAHQAQPCTDPWGPRTRRPSALFRVHGAIMQAFA